MRQTHTHSLTHSLTHTLTHTHTSFLLQDLFDEDKPNVDLAMFKESIGTLPGFVFPTSVQILQQRPDSVSRSHAGAVAAERRPTCTNRLSCCFAQLQDRDAFIFSYALVFSGHYVTSLRFHCPMEIECVL